MRILIFFPCFTYGGAEKQAFGLAQHLRSKGHHVEAWGFTSPTGTSPLVADLEKIGVSCHEISEWPKLEWDDLTYNFNFGLNIAKKLLWAQRIRKLSRLIPKKQFDVAIPFTFWPSLAVALFRHQLGYPRGIWNHRGGYDTAGINYSKFLIAQISRSKPIFVANSSIGVKFLNDNFHPSPGPVHLIPNAITAFDNNSKPSSKIKHTNNSKIQLIQIANHYPEKDFRTLLIAFDKLNFSAKKFHLHLVGSFISPSDKQAFFSEINQLESRSHITHHGSLAPHLVEELLDICDIGILSSRSEGCPNCIMEYMRKGLPVIASDIPASRDLLPISNHQNLFHTGNANALKQLIESLAASPALRLSQGVENRAHIFSKFNRETIFDLWDKIILHNNINK